MRKEKRKLLLTFFITWCITLAIALPAFSQSSFLEQFVGINGIAIFLVGASAASVLIILVYPKLIRRYGNYYTTLGAVITAVFGLVFLTQQLDTWVLLFLFIVQYTCFAIIGINLDIFLESVTSEEHTGRVRTVFHTTRALAGITAPLIMGYVVSNFTLSFPYFLSALILIPVALLLVVKKKLLDEKTEFTYYRLRDVNRSVRRSKSLRCVFQLQFCLQMYYALMILYTPIYLNQYLGIPWDELGIIFTIMIMPFILFQIPAGTLADKYFGEKEITIIGIIIIALSLIAAFLTTSSSGIIWIIILFSSRLGAALVQAMTESYFFKHVNVSDLDFIDVFRAVKPMGWLIASAVSLLVVGNFPLQYIYIVITIISLLALKPAIALPDTK